MGYYFVDEAGSRWSGKNCPKCKQDLHREWHQQYKIIKPVFNGATEAVQAALVPTTPTRHCRKCKNPLSSSNYFYHNDCRPDVDYLDWSEVGAIPPLGSVLRGRGDRC